MAGFKPLLFAVSFQFVLKKLPRAGFFSSERRENVGEVKFETATRAENHNETNGLVLKPSAVSAQCTSVASAVVENSQTLEAHYDGELTVKQDARVVAWEILDLGSSRTAKAIVDESHRAEDVQIVLITAERDQALDIGVPELTVRSFIRSHLGISDSTSTTYAFVSKAGEQITGYRRPNVDCCSMHRIPTFLRVLSEDGETASLSNLGNECRFGRRHAKTLPN